MPESIAKTYVTRPTINQVLEDFKGKATEAEIRQAYEGLSRVGDQFQLVLKPKAVIAPADIKSVAPSIAAPQKGGLAQKISTLTDKGVQFLDRMATDKVHLATEYELKQSLNLGPNVRLDVQSDVIKSSPNAAQQQFFRDNPDGRIVRTVINVDAQSGDLLHFGELQGNVKGSYQIVVEMPFAGFSQGDWAKQLKSAKARLAPVINQARMATGGFWEDVKAGDFPAGTRIVRTVNLGAGANLSSSGATASADRSTRIIFDTVWSAKDTLNVTIDTLRNDKDALSAKLGAVGAGVNASDSNHHVHTYTGLDVSKRADLEALKESISWTNGLLPNQIDTSKLDHLGKGRHSFDVLHGKGAHGNVWLPVAYMPAGASASVSAGASYSDLDRYTLSVPDADSKGQAVLEDEAAGYITALRKGDADQLTKGIAGLTIQNISTAETAKNLGAKLSAAYDYMPGYLSAGIVASFGRNTSDKDVVARKIEYHQDNPQMADVTIWKIDTEQMVNKFAIEASLMNLNPAVRDQIADALNDYLLRGVGLEQYAEKIADVPFNKLKSYADKVKLGMSFQQASTEYGFESLLFKDFNLNRATDAKAFVNLVTNFDPVLATKNGHLIETVTRHRSESKSTFDATAFGYQLFFTDNKDWAAGQTQTISQTEPYDTADEKGDIITVQERVELAALEAGATQDKIGLTEGHAFNADTFVTFKTVYKLVDGKTALGEDNKPIIISRELTDSAMRVWNRGTDSMFRQPEADRIVNATPASFRVVDKFEGDGDWLLEWPLGKNFKEVQIDLSALINLKGNASILRSEPEMVERNVIMNACKTLGTTLPPSEVEMAFDLPAPVRDLKIPVSLNAAQAGNGELANLAKIFRSVWSPDMKPNKMHKVRDEIIQKVRDAAGSAEGVWVSDVDGKGTSENVKISNEALIWFESINDHNLGGKEFNEILYRSTATALMMEYRALVDQFGTNQPTDQDDSEKLRDVTSSYYFLTKRFDGQPRNLEADMWVMDQGHKARAIFELPEVKAARARLATGDVLKPEEAKDITELFRKVAKQYRPSKTVINTQDDVSALSFWTTLLGLAGSDESGRPNAVAMFHVNGPNYRYTATSHGADPDQIREAIKAKTAEAAMQQARKENSIGQPHTGG